MRKLLFIDNTGKIYLITTNMDPQFTGCYSPVKELFNTIIDGLSGDGKILVPKKETFSVMDEEDSTGI